MKYEEAKLYLLRLKDHLNLESFEDACDVVLNQADKIQIIKEISNISENKCNELKKYIEEIISQ